MSKENKDSLVKRWANDKNPVQVVKKAEGDKPKKETKK